MTDSREVRLARARTALDGLSVGDAFGEQFFYVSPDSGANHIYYRTYPFSKWEWTDDTNMALSVYAALRRDGGINQDWLARSFAEHYDPSRKYGPTMHGVFTHITHGVPWREAAGSLFSGQGSYGNGAAMRIAPLGAYFADDLDVVVELAERASEVTHAHEEGIAGGIAAAVATALAWRIRGKSTLPSRAEFIDRLIEYVPVSEVQSKLRRARDITPGTQAAHAAAMLGNGSRISAQDTVPFTVWCAIEHITNYEEALWTTASIGGDIDTNCAIVGGIVASYTGDEGIPAAWREAREPLPEWAFVQ